MRTNRILWDDHHMLLAMVTAQRSPDPNTQVGACIVDKNHRVVGLGYNSTPRGVDCNLIPWEREHKDPLETKYPYIVHAENNAIHNSVGSIKGAKIYTTLYPCNNCAGDIIQAGIREVIYLTNPYKEIWWTEAATRLLQSANVPTRQHRWIGDKTSQCLQNLHSMIK